MPELPEVEVTRRQLEPMLVGRTVSRVRTTADSYFFLTRPGSLKRRLKARRVERLERVGKYLLAGLDDGSRLLLHLGMTGQIFAGGSSSVRLLAATARSALEPDAQRAGFRPDEHTHLTLSFADDGPDVHFRDVRKFGKVQLLRPNEPCSRLERLGADALSLTSKHLYEATRRRRIPIKALLLDQSMAAGIGNIYADEALHGAGVRPGRAAARLSRAEATALAAGVRRVLRRAIQTGGSSISDYVQPDGSDGRYQDERRVYGLTDEPCQACGTPIRRKVIGGRSSHYCPACQR